MSSYPASITHARIYGKRDEYCGWPSVARMASGDIVVAFCVSEEHMAPSGAILSVRSSDAGKTWSEPVTILDSIIDDREAGLTLLDGGQSLMVHMWSTHHTAATYRGLAESSYRADVLERWIAHVEAPTYLQAAGLEGATTSVTTDGTNWSTLHPGTDSIHGGVQLPDGSVCIASYRVRRPNVGIYRGSGTPLTWQLMAELALPNLTSTRFGEPHIALLPSGRLLVVLRSTAIPYDDSSRRNLLWMTYSDDGGVSWVEPYPTPLWGFPAHLLVLADGRVLCTYGYRRRPFGQRACISEDGVTWRAEDEIILRDDAHDGDLGYPASVEVEPGRILSVYYQPIDEGGPAQMTPPDPCRAKPDIWGSIWDLP
jgi:sialidase-1